MKACTKCSTSKPLDEFGADKNRAGGKAIYCKRCTAVLNKVIRKRNNSQRTDYNKRYRVKNREKYNAWERDYFAKNRDRMNTKSKDWRDNESGTFVVMHLSAQSRARKKNLDYVLTPRIIRSMCESQGNKCLLTGIPFDYSKTEHFTRRPFAPSIDRKNSTKGYSLDNVQITCSMVNVAKSEYHQEMFDAMCIARVRCLNVQT